MSLCENLDQEIYEELEKIAYQQTKPFCYSCYRQVKQQYCSSCGSDDNMRYLEGVGVEYGVTWVIEHIVSENCAPIDPDFAEESLRGYYPESVKIGWIEADPINILKEMYPLDYRLAKDEYIDGLKDDGEIVTIDGVDYWKDDIMKFIEENKEMEVA